jgi:PAS domain S-box-containing protein
VANGRRELDFSFVDSLVVPASVHDVEGRFVHVNAAAEQAAGTSRSELLTLRYTDLLRPEERPHVEAQFRRAVEQGEPADFETVFVDSGGHVRGVRAQYVPLREGEQIVGVLILAYEVRALPNGARVPCRPDLTPRQREVLELLASGWSTQEIARALFLAPETVRNHVRNVFRELSAHTRPEAIAAAHRLGLLAAAPLRPAPLDS